MEIRREVYGEAHIETGRGMYGEAVALKSVGNFSESLQLLEKAATVFEITNKQEDDMYRETISLILDAL